jgi:hypothetical protein
LVVGDDFAADVDMPAALDAVGRDAARDVVLAARLPRVPVAGLRVAVVFFLCGLLPVAIVTLSARTSARPNRIRRIPAPRTTASTDVIRCGSTMAHAIASN